MRNLAEQEKFEKWMLTERKCLPDWEGKDPYTQGLTHDYWLVWQARALLSQEASLSMVEPEIVNQSKENGKHSSIFGMKKILNIVMDEQKQYAKSKTTWDAISSISRVIRTAILEEKRLLKESAASAVPADWINFVIRDVQELPDRDSPDDWPDAMLVTAEELKEIILRHCAPTPPTKSEQRLDNN